MVDNKTNQYLLRNSDEYLEYFVYLDELRESGTINMMGAPREMQYEFGIDKLEARNIFQLWCLNFESAEDPEQYTQRAES
jgi:hypothetical protein